MRENWKRQLSDRPEKVHVPVSDFAIANLDGAKLCERVLSGLDQRRR